MKMMDNGESDIYSGVYIGKTLCGFVHNETYTVKVSKDNYGYHVEELDESSDCSNTAYMRYSSAKSVEHYWNFTN